ncbi:hypothetical protein BB560_000147 [Smittium megazygosporum]|uniref:Palmitoyltransferase n=1 Tax=Smittium megazygosporum TaxID=133381 RepID=A0A2T9ZLC3_9FUNG|nr:hypothetical protein BB560_000147 [Smittium megazygosporum]
MEYFESVFLCSNLGSEYIIFSVSRVPVADYWSNTTLGRWNKAVLRGVSAKIRSRPQTLAIIGVSLNVFFYVMTYFSDPGIITKENYKKAMELYEYDNVLYFPRYCKVCEITCPPRSYHCNMCNHCIMGYDHHCILTHKCIGIRNERYLYGFCLTFIMICFMGFSFNFATMMKFATNEGFPPSYYYDSETKHFNISKGFYVTMGVFSKHPSEWILNFILLFGVPVGGIFIIFQSYLHLAGITTYEHYRRVKLRNDVKEKRVYFVIPPEGSGKKKFVTTIDPNKPDENMPIDDDCKKVLVNYADQIPFAYDAGYLKNVKKVAFPPF